MYIEEEEELLKSGNPILDKNLECIKSYNPTLVQELLELEFLTNDIKLIETEMKEPNLTYNDFPLHSQVGAENEAKEIFKKSENTSLNINIIFGMGLGYLFKEFCENSLGPVVLYEPNLEILRVTLELVDFSKELSQKNVKISSNLQGLEQSFKSVWKYKSEVDVLVLNSYAKLHREELDEVFKKLEILKAMLMLDSNLVSNMGLEFLSTVLDNLSYSLDAIPLNNIKDIYKGKTALIVSAGPTLDLNIETIKKNREKVIIFSIGSALKALVKNGIAPDFVNIEEIQDVSGQVNGIDLSNVNLILAPYTNKSIHKLNVKQKFLFPSASTRGGRYWSHLTGMDVSEYIVKGTVSYQALSSAKILGFKKIILVGQDLAYLNNSCYSKDSAYSDIVFETNPETGKSEFKIKDCYNYAKHMLKDHEDITQIDCKKMADETIQELNSRLCFVKGISGEMLPTQADYAAFIEVFREFASLNGDLELINTSMIGVQIDGFENISLKNALENNKPIKRLNPSINFRYDKKTIFENLKKEENYFKNILNKFNETKEYFYKIDRELHRKKIITNDVCKYYNLLSKIYNFVSSEYFNKNEFYQIIVSKEGLELEYYLTTTKDTGNKKINNSYILVKNYFQNVDKISKIISKIEKQKEIIGGSINSEASKNIVLEI